MTTKNLNAGVIGTGFIGPVHVEALRRLGVIVTALCDLPDRARIAADKYGIPEAYSDYRDLIRSPNVDVVHITAPNRCHYRMAMETLRAGKHCICEKPLAMNTRQTAELAAEARKRAARGQVFAVNYNVRFYPAVLQMRRMVAKGELGQIVHVNGSYFQDWLIKDTDYNWRLLPEEGGGLRAVADIGTHWMDTVSFILDAPISAVFAKLATFHKTRRRPKGEVESFARTDASAKLKPYHVKTEDFASILLQFRNGVHGNLAVSQVAAGRKNCIRIEVYGSRKSAWWCSENPEFLGLGQRDGPNEIAIRGTPSFGPDAAPYVDYPAGHVEGFPDTFKMLFRAVYGTIARSGNGERLFANAGDGHREVAVCEAILKSHKIHAWVRL